MTKKVLDRLPLNVVKTIDIWKNRYNDVRINKETCKAEIRGYLKGLSDLGYISVVEFRLLLCYMTL